jgi:hypothetical protein
MSSRSADDSPSGDGNTPTPWIGPREQSPDYIEASQRVFDPSVLRRPPGGSNPFPPRDWPSVNDAPILHPGLWYYEYIYAADKLVKAMLDAPKRGESFLASCGPYDRSLSVIAAACQFKICISREYVVLFGNFEEFYTDICSRGVAHSSVLDFVHDFDGVTSHIEDLFNAWVKRESLSPLLEQFRIAYRDDESFEDWLTAISRLRPAVTEEERIDLLQAKEDCAQLLSRLESFGIYFGRLGHLTSSSRHGLFFGTLRWIDKECQDEFGRTILQAILSSLFGTGTKEYLRIQVGVARTKRRFQATAENDSTLDDGKVVAAEGYREDGLNYRALPRTPNADQLDVETLQTDPPDGRLLKPKAEHGAKTAQPPPEPSEKAFEAYRLKRDPNKSMSQATIAQKVYGHRKDQPKVSRDLKRVTEWVSYGFSVPDPAPEKPKRSPKRASGRKPRT